MLKKPIKISITAGLLLAGTFGWLPEALSQTTFWDCTPAQIGVFSNRVYIRCTTPTPAGISYFAFPNSDSGLAARFLSAFTTAKVTAKIIRIHYFPSESGAAYGCEISNCRPISGVEVQP